MLTYPFTEDEAAAWATETPDGCSWCTTAEGNRLVVALVNQDPYDWRERQLRENFPQYYR